MVYKLFKNGAAGSSSLDARDDGNIVGILLSTDAAAAGNIEVGFNSTGSFTQNDTTGTLMSMNVATDLPQTAFCQMMEPVSVGERIFLHTDTANTVIVTIFTDRTPPKTTPRRR